MAQEAQLPFPSFSSADACQEGYIFSNQPRLCTSKYNRSTLQASYKEIYPSIKLFFMFFEAVQ